MDIICDIDGTLADCTHRLHHIQKTPRDWDAFFAATADDKPIMPIVVTVSCLNLSHRLIYCSGRPEKTRQATVDWLRRHACRRRRSTCARMAITKTTNT